jgi:hypothetical protein
MSEDWHEMRSFHVVNPVTCSERFVRELSSETSRYQSHKTFLADRLKLRTTKKSPSSQAMSYASERNGFTPKNGFTILWERLTGLTKTLPSSLSLRLGYLRPPMRTQGEERGVSPASMDVNAVETSTLKEMQGPNSTPPLTLETKPMQNPHFPTCLAHYNAILQHLEASSSVSDEALELLSTLQTNWPHAPPHEVLFGEPWDISKPLIRTNSHQTNNFNSALTNVTNTGRIVSKSEQSYLRFLLSYWQGWSATLPQHKNDPCFKYIQWRFRHVGHLHPILDNASWPEEVALLPAGVVASLPSHFLLATEECYYVYITEMDILYHAGKSLESVFIGLKEGRDRGTLEDGSWEYEELPPIEEDWFCHFPDWSFRSNGFNDPFEEVEPFVPPSDL